MRVIGKQNVLEAGKGTVLIYNLINFTGCVCVRVCGSVIVANNSFDQYYSETTQILRKVKAYGSSALAPMLFRETLSAQSSSGGSSWWALVHNQESLPLIWLPLASDV